MRASVVITVLFLVGGALGGWWFLADNAVSEAHAQVQGQCGPGRVCSSSKFRATTAAVDTVALPDTGSVCLDYPTCTYRLVQNSGRILATGGFKSDIFNVTAASGANGISFSTNGGRLDMGNGSVDYCISNGTYVVCNGSSHGVVLRRGQADGVDVASIAAGTCDDAATTVTLAGASLTDGSVCMVGNTPGGTGIAADVVPYAWPSDATTVTIRLCCNNAASACDPASQNYHVTCLE